MYDRRRAVAAILALSLLLLPSLSFASGNGDPRHSASSVGPLELVVHWLARAWSVVSGSEPIDRAWQAGAGCGIDPNGLPILPCIPLPGISSPTGGTAGTDPTQ